jgi:hypothetical protein
MSRWAGFAIAAALAAAALGAGCGGHPPPPARGVVESDLGAWKFRRYQPLLDVEVYVANNKAEAFTASYVSDRAERERPGRLTDDDIVNVFVTRYEKPAGVQREMVRFARRLAQEAGYVVEESKIGGERVVTVSGHGEWWAMWAAPRHVVKIGGRGRTNVPGDLVKVYGKRYPSELSGGVLEGPLPAGPDAPAKPGADQPYDPDNPAPDWKGYDPSKPGPAPGGAK